MNARMEPLRTASFDDGQLVHEVFECQAELSPNATAISFLEQQISYGELNRRSNQLAHALLDCGLLINQPVAIMLEDGPQQIISLLGVIKAGGAIVCLDPEHPPARMRLVMEQACPPIVISDNACLQRCRESVKVPDSSLLGILLLEPDTLKFIQPDSDQEAASLPYVDALPSFNPGLSLDPLDPVYIVYTSGSTGLPKGIVQSHRSFCQFIEWQSNQFGIRAPQRLVQWASISYDAGYRQIFGSLCFGATLCMAPSSIRYNPQAFVTWLNTARVSILNVVPSFCSEIVKAIDANDFGDGGWPLPHLEQMLLTGEALSASLARKWLALFPAPTKLFNLYGPSECILATCFAVEHVTADQASVSIGKAIAGREILILDENQAPCPGDVTGEIYIRSDYLTLGYLGCQSETDSKFIQNPCHNDYPDPVYRTGDLGRWALDGQVEFAGRKDSQVKLRGMRVELGEIEAALQSVKEIDTCAVVVHTALHKRKNLIAKDRDSRKNVEADEQQVLIAYFTTTDDLCSADLQQILAERLPSHMIPQRFITLSEMPVNANRKLDRIALESLDYKRLQHEKKYVAPRNANELAIAEIWSEVLGIDRIGVDDSFFELGGDSLLAMQVLNRIRRNISANLSFRDLLESQNVGELAKLVDDKPILAVPAKVEAALPEHQVDIPLTLAQQGIWFLWRLEPDSPYYTGQGTLQLRGELDLALLQQAWSALLERHQILRVKFETRDGQPVQTFDDAPVTPLSCTDLTHVPADEQWREIEKVAAKKTENSLNLERDQLFHGQLFKLSEDEHQLMLSFHEIVLDLWGLSILVKDLTSLYHQSVEGGIASLSPGNMTFREYALWEHRNIRRDTLQQQEAYWREQLDGELPVLQLPTDRPRPTVPSYKGASHSIVLSAEESRKIRQISSDHDATLFMTLLGAFNILLRAYSGQDDIVVGAPIANRTNEGVEDLAGFFLNMLPLRTRIDNDPRFTDLLSNVRETVTGAICNAEYPFMWMLDAADVKRHLSVTPVFQVMFNMLNLPQASSHAGDLEITYNEIDTPYIKYDLCLYAQEHDNQIYLELSYLTDLFDESTISRLLENYRVLLNSLVANPELPVSKLTLLSDSERDALVKGSNESHRDYQNELCIHQLFERQVEKTPCSVAFVCSEGHITYSELNKRSNQLARHLQALGVERDTRVAICLERGLEMMVGLLAVMKAGGVYVALDPDYPQLRLTDILADTGANVLLLQEPTDCFADYVGTKVYIDSDWKQIDTREVNNLDCVSDTTDLLNIVYTSSTTGSPKGVLINMDAVLNRLLWMWEAYPFEPDSVALLQKSYSLVAATWECFGALLKGFPTVIVTRRELMDPSVLWRVLVTNKVTHLLASPAVIEGVLTEAEAHPGQWESLRLATTSAEPIAPAMVKRWQAVFSDTPLLNLYGSTECSSNATHYDTQRLSELDSRVPIGTPLPNTRAYILDKNLDLRPMGAVGELCISGACIARGYLNNPDLTEQQFVRDPFSSQEDARLYKTGDLARYRTDGSIELLGRADRQVNIRGFRIELNDIEYALQQHECVQKCAVILREPEPGDSRLAAYIVVNDDVSNDALRTFLKERVPDYMVPADFVFLTSLPLTAAGKIDSRALPEPDNSRPQLEMAFVAPSGPTETAVAGIWVKLLDVALIGVDDDFFALGGHSLLAATMLSRVRDLTGVEVPLRVLFENPSIDGLVTYIETCKYINCDAANDSPLQDREEIVL